MIYHDKSIIIYPIGSMYAIYGNIYHQYTSNVSIYTIHGSYGYRFCQSNQHIVFPRLSPPKPPGLPTSPVLRRLDGCSPLAGGEKVPHRHQVLLFTGPWWRKSGKALEHLAPNCDVSCVFLLYGIWWDSWSDLVCQVGFGHLVNSMVHGRYMYLVNGVQNPPADNVWPPCYKLDYKPQ